MPTLIKKNDCPPKMTRYALKVTQICHPLLGREEKCEPRNRLPFASRVSGASRRFRSLEASRQIYHSGYCQI
jgi:hypothetical protein